jgi:hypothetical protein
VKHKAPIVRFARRAANASYHTVLYPYKTERPELSVAEIPVQRGEQVCSPAEAFALSITITRNGQSFKDTYFNAEPDSDQEYHFADFTCKGSLLFVRQDAAGNIVNIQKQPDTSLKSGSPEATVVSLAMAEDET